MAQNNLNEFHQSLGEALTQWQVVEKHLYAVFLRLMASKRKGVTSACYHAVSALEARLAMTNQAAHQALASTPLLKEWEDLHEKIGNKKKLRNALAHGESGYKQQRNGRVGPEDHELDERSRHRPHGRRLIPYLHPRKPR